MSQMVFFIAVFVFLLLILLLLFYQYLQFLAKIAIIIAAEG